MSFKKSSCQRPTFLISWKGTDLVLEGVFLNSLFVNPQCLGSFLFVLFLQHVLSYCLMPRTVPSADDQKELRHWPRPYRLQSLWLTNISKSLQYVMRTIRAWTFYSVIYMRNPCSRASECFLGRLYCVLKDIIQCLSLAKCSAFLFLKALIHPYLDFSSFDPWWNKVIMGSFSHISTVLPLLLISAFW